MKVFESSNGECLSLATLYNESGFGGYEDLLIFKKDFYGCNQKLKSTSTCEMTF